MLTLASILSVNIHMVCFMNKHCATVPAVNTSPKNLGNLKDIISLLYGVKIRMLTNMFGLGKRGCYRAIVAGRGGAGKTEILL